MARYNELLVGRFNRFTQKIFSMKGPASLVTVSDELQPVWTFFNGNENRYLESWDIVPYGVNRNAVAANVHQIRLRNPAGSNLLAVIERITISSGGNDQVHLSFDPTTTTTDLATILPAAFVYDPRSARKSFLTVSVTEVAANTDLQVFVGQLQTPTQGAFEWVNTVNQEIPLLPGAAFQVGDGVVNLQLAVCFQWRERFLEESERT